jgi:hypothetical protein
MRQLLFLLPGLILCLPVLAREINLTVTNHTSTALRGQPVRGGIPLPRGEWQEPQAQLLDEQGRPLPCQARATARWYDGSLKWLLVDTQVNLQPQQALKLRLVPGASAVSGPRVTVEQRPAEIVVDTGRARFLFSRREFGCPAAVWLDLDGDGKFETRATSGPAQFACEIEHTPPGEPQEENWLRDSAGGEREGFVARADGDYQVEVEQANDLRVVIKLSGWLTNAAGRKLLQYFIRAHAFAGRPDLLLVPTFVYAGNPKQDFIRSLVLAFPRTSGGEASWALGGETVHRGTLTAQTSPVSLYALGPDKIYHLAPYDQDKTVTYTVRQGLEKIAGGKEPRGWARISDQRGSLQLAVRDFWQMHPKEIRLRPDVAQVYLWPESGGKVLDLRRRYDEVENVYHYDLSLWPYGGEGVGVTHEIMLRFDRPASDEAAALSAALDHPLLLQCEPQHVADTRAFGHFQPVDRERFPHLEGVQDVGVAWIQRNQQQFQWNGLIDYGDTLFHGYNTPSHYGYISPKGWCSRGYVGWLNDDGGLTNALFVRYLATGDYATFRLAENMARHSLDVDTCHHCAAEPRFVGGGHRHDQQHWGNGTRGYGTATHGIINYYLLTGYERALDVALETAQYHIDPFEGENEDRPGGLIRIWEITGEAKYKEAADKILAEELAQPASPQWFFTIPGHFRMVLNSSTNYMYYLSCAAPADSAALREAVLKTADANLQTYLSSWDDPGSYLPLQLLALAYDLSGERRHIEGLAALVQRLRLPLKEVVPPDLLATLRAMPFPELPELVIGKWGVNNIYTLQLNGFNALPYIQAAFTKAGLDQAGYLQVARVNNPPPPFEEILDPAKIGEPWKSKGQPSFLYPYTLQQGAPDDRIGRSKLLLYEDGKLLGPAHNGHRDTMEKGLGRWSHWGTRSIQFSTSDNSDPRTNGRQYKIVNPQ